jgi:integrase/recombinase XerD
MNRLSVSTQDSDVFDPQAITTTTLSQYRTYLQTAQRQKAASVNRSLISLKRYFSWAIRNHLIIYDPSTAVKLVGQEDITSRQLDDQKEQALVAAVMKSGVLRKRVLIVLLLHTALRAQEICQLRRDQVKLGKRNKYREVPLKATSRTVLEDYLPTFPPDAVSLFPSGKKKDALSERALGYIVKKYMSSAKHIDVSLYDLRHRFGYRMAELFSGIKI